MTTSRWLCSRCSEMPFRWLLTFVFALTAAALPAQTLPTEYATFMSHGKGVSCAVYDARDAAATIIFLRGAGPSDVAFGRQQAHFFAEHGFRVLLPDYFSTTLSADATAANYRRWAQVVEDIVAELRARPIPQNEKIALAGQALGASVALVAGSRRIEVEAIAEWSGALPNEFFSQVQSMPPLLILHGEVDKQMPIVNARQLVRLCQLRDFTCETQFYAGEGHVFSSHIMESANQRVLAFFHAYLR
jgi:dipeptidyl aminopeptidase/acylaminoacyl peptidase